MFDEDMKTWYKQGGLPEKMCGMDGGFVCNSAVACGEGELMFRGSAVPWGGDPSSCGKAHGP